jgi:hypothetical protein
MVRILILIGMAMSSLCVFAQELAVKQGGGFGHFQAGVSLGYFPALTRYLAKPEILGDSYSPQQGGIQLGGGGYGLVGKILLGGSGYFSGFNSVKTDSASVSVSAGAGLFNLGYLLKSTDRWLLFPYAGIGGSGITLKISNESDSGGIYFDSQKGLGFGEISRLSIGGIAYEIGFSIKYFATRLSEDNLHGGIMLGLDFGCQNALFTRNKWADGKGQELRGPNSMQGFLPYLRITVGGGGIYPIR